jgi:N4-gp56 family major capsid protein
VPNVVTTSANVIDPQVWADTVSPLLLGKSVMAGLSTQDDTLVGTPGSTVSFGTWVYSGDARDAAEGVEIEADGLSMTERHVSIKEIGKRLDLTDTATLIALASPNSEAVSQSALAISRKIDTDLRVAAELVTTGEFASSPLIFPTVAASLTYDAYVDASALWGDEYDPANVAALIVHSKQYTQLRHDPDFITVDKIGDRASIITGQIGSLAGVAVIVSDRATAIGTAGTADAGHNALLIRRGALALRYKRRALVETDRNIAKRINTVVTTAHYAAHRADDRGVIVLGVLDAAV